MAQTPTNTNALNVRAKLPAAKASLALNKFTTTPATSTNGIVMVVSLTSVGDNPIEATALAININPSTVSISGWNSFSLWWVSVDTSLRLKRNWFLVYICHSIFTLRYFEIIFLNIIFNI